MTLLIFLIVLTILVIVHELGHFIVAKKRGVTVEEFGVGFPPRLIAFKKGETVYSINILPLGGFVKLKGENYLNGEDTAEKKIDPKMFINKKPWEKAFIVIAGVIGNFLLGWLILSFLFTKGTILPSDKVIIQSVQPKSPAEKVGLRSNDELKSVIVGQKKYGLQSSQDIINLSRQYAGQEIILEVKRDGKSIFINITPRKNPPKGEGPLGIVIKSFVEKKYPWYQAPFSALKEAIFLTKKIISELAKAILSLFLLKKPQVEVAGPLAIAIYTGQAAKLGLDPLLLLIALLSFNLAVVNLLPFPALDGGRLCFILYEWITGRRLNKKFEYYANIIGFISLIFLAFLITYRDIITLFK